MEFTADGIRRVAETAWEVNERTENIGARRLHTVMERLLEEVSFSAGDGGDSLTSTAPMWTNSWANCLKMKI